MSIEPTKRAVKLIESVYQVIGGKIWTEAQYDCELTGCLDTSQRPEKMFILCQETKWNAHLVSTKL